MHPPPGEPPLRDLPTVLPILHRDEHLVAVHKPAGLLVHRSELDRHAQQFAVQMVRAQTGRHVYPVHRLDRATSGVLLFAFDAGVAGILGERFMSRDVTKTYLAVVRGIPGQHGVIDHPLRRRDDLPGRVSRHVPGAAQPALTAWRRLAECELPHAVEPYPTSRYSLLALQPHTGRRHQLRRHMKHAAHPLIGDTTYGKSAHNRLFERLFGSRRLLLACVRLRLEHPADGRTVDLVAPPAADFAGVLDALGWGDAAAAVCEPRPVDVPAPTAPERAPPI